MTRLLAEAVEAARALPEGLQDEIGRALLDHIQKLSTLQAEINLCLEGLAKTGGKELTEDVWKEMKAEAIKRASGA